MTTTFKSSILNELQWRERLDALTHAEELDATLQQGPVTLYCGFDPTADSLHVGNLIPIMGLAFFSRHGHNPIMLAGGATGRIGDPSGKAQERSLRTPEEIEANLTGIQGQLESIMANALKMHPETIERDPSSPATIRMVNNHAWMQPWSYIDFLRDVGKFFSVNAMIAKESVSARLNEREQGISYTEFSYMLIQAFDFFHLFQNYGCTLQIGGSDQWGNMTAGTQLIRRKASEKAYAVTFPLLTTSDGRKFGKSESGAVWLCPEKTSPYNFYQYWIQQPDIEVPKLLRAFTFLSQEEILALDETLQSGNNRGQVQKTLAREVTTLIHGAEECAKAERASRMLFGEEISGLNDRDLHSIFQDVPSTHIPRNDLSEGIHIVDLFVQTGLAKSRGAAKKLLKQGGGYINNRRTTLDHSVTETDLASETMLVLRAGKKAYHVVQFNA